MKLIGRVKVKKLSALVVFSMLLQIIVLPNLFRASSADCLPPTFPKLSAEWRSELPEITASNPPNAPAVTKAYWARSFYTSLSNKWGEWSAWKEVPYSANGTSIPSSDLGNKSDIVAYSVYFSNQCGNSYTTQITLPIIPKSKIKFQPTVISDVMPLRVKQIPINKLVEESFSFEKSVTSANPKTCSYDAKAETLNLFESGVCEVVIDVNRPEFNIGLPAVRQSFKVIGDPKALERTTIDRPDDEKKFQVHLVYVVPQGQPDKGLDTNGQIALWSELANDWLNSKISRELIFDTYQGDLDVSYMRSKYTVSELPYDDAYQSDSSKFGTLEKLFREYSNQSKTLTGKSYFFVVQGELSTKFCGWAQGLSQVGLMLISDRCWKDTSDDIGYLSGISNASGTLVHELLHNFGVGHICKGNTDIMFSSVDCPGEQKYPVTLDLDKSQYLGSAVGGEDILNLKVWMGDLGNRYHISGNCYINQPCKLPGKQWSSGSQVLELQIKKGNSWIKVDTFKAFKNNGMKKYPYTYNVTLTHKAPGTFTYRYFLQANSKYSKYADKPFQITVPY